MSREKASVSCLQGKQAGVPRQLGQIPASPDPHMSLSLLIREMGDTFHWTASTTHTSFLKRGGSEERKLREGHGWGLGLPSPQGRPPTAQHPTAAGVAEVGGPGSGSPVCGDRASLCGEGL